MTLFEWRAGRALTRLSGRTLSPAGLSRHFRRYKVKVTSSMSKRVTIQPDRSHAGSIILYGICYLTITNFLRDRCGSHDVKEPVQ
jgi:hypothetical protein